MAEKKLVKSTLSKCWKCQFAEHGVNDSVIICRNAGVEFFRSDVSLSIFYRGKICVEDCAAFEKRRELYFGDGRPVFAECCQHNREEQINRTIHYGGPNGKTFLMAFVQLPAPEESARELRKPRVMQGIGHYRRVNFCPFCGKELKLAVVEE
jgi:hypothetical protein